MQASFVAFCSLWHFGLLVVITPVFLGPLDVGLLTTLCAATKEDYQIRAVLPTIDPIPRANVLENQFDDAFANIVPLSKRSQTQAGNSLVNLAFANWIAEAIEPFIKRTTTICRHVVFDSASSDFHL